MPTTLASEWRVPSNPGAAYGNAAPFRIAPKQECSWERTSTTPLPERRLCIMSILLVVIIVIVVLALLGFFGRGRFGR